MAKNSFLGDDNLKLNLLVFTGKFLMALVRSLKESSYNA